MCWFTNSQISSSSSGKQKKPHSGHTFINKESISNKDLSSRSPLSAIHSSMTSKKIRSPSPPIRRSISTDRASIIKTKSRLHTTSRIPIQRLQLPEPIYVGRAENNELSETEMNCGLTDSLTGNAEVRKAQSIVAKISETMDSRYHNI